VDRRFLRPGWIAGHVLVLLAFLTCLRLGWWQWGRTHDADGTAQNLGYALLWPAFGVAFIYMWVRFLHLEVLKDAQDDEETEQGLRALLDAEARSPDAAPELAGARGADDVADDEPRDLPTAAADRPADRRPFDGRPFDDRPADADDRTAEEPPGTARRRRRLDPQRPSRAVIISVAMVGEDDEDDPELTEYNRALAALAEEDRRRAR
jgi:DNA-binding transcriptional regulator of glucitol operon